MWSSSISNYSEYSKQRGPSQFIQKQLRLPSALAWILHGYCLISWRYFCVYTHYHIMGLSYIMCSHVLCNMLYNNAIQWNAIQMLYSIVFSCVIQTFNGGNLTGDTAKNKQCNVNSSSVATATWMLINKTTQSLGTTASTCRFYATALKDHSPPGV